MVCEIVVRIISVEEVFSLMLCMSDAMGGSSGICE